MFVEALIQSKLANLDRNVVPAIPHMLLEASCHSHEFPVNLQLEQEKSLNQIFNLLIFILAKLAHFELVFFALLLYFV
jgi:hypothetical protein